MATVYRRKELPLNDVAPEVGKKYFWFQHDRSLLVLTILEVGTGAGAGIKMKWEIYLKLMGENDPRDGEVVWNEEEWKAATLKEFVYPVQKEDLKEDEELCRTCGGMYWYFERDHDVCGCLWCEEGRTKKRVEPPQPTQRSSLHPMVPPKLDHETSTNQ